MLNVIWPAYLLVNKHDQADNQRKLGSPVCKTLSHFEALFTQSLCHVLLFIDATLRWRNCLKCQTTERTIPLCEMQVNTFHKLSTIRPGLFGQNLSYVHLAHCRAHFSSTLLSPTDKSSGDACLLHGNNGDFRCSHVTGMHQICWQSNVGFWAQLCDLCCERLTLKVGQVLNGLNNFNLFPDTISYCLKIQLALIY